MTATLSGTNVTLSALTEGAATVTVTAQDPDGLSASSAFAVTVTESSGENRPPTLVGQIPGQSLEIGGSRALTASSYFIDPDSDELDFSAESSDAGVLAATVSGNEVTLSALTEGTATVTIAAQDPDGLTAASDFGVIVSEAGEENRSPAVVSQIPDQTVAEATDRTLAVSSYFVDPDGDSLTYGATTDDSNVATASASEAGVMLTSVASGQATITIVATDPDGLSAEQQFGIRVVEHPPDLVAVGPNVNDSTPEAGGTFWFIATVTNDGDAQSQSAATTVRYLRSTDATITQSDTQEGTDAVRALRINQGYGATIRLTAPSTAGTYYYGACVDAVPDEVDTGNNCSASVQVDVQIDPQTASSVEVTAPQDWSPVGESVTYEALVLDSQGEEVDGAEVSWPSSSEIVTVDTEGVVTAKASAVESALRMHVVEPVARVNLEPGSLTFESSRSRQTTARRFSGHRHRSLAQRRTLHSLLGLGAMTGSNSGSGCPLKSFPSAVRTPPPVLGCWTSWGQLPVCNRGAQFSNRGPPRPARSALPD